MLRSGGDYPAQDPPGDVMAVTAESLCHSTLILIGMPGLAKALAGKCFRYLSLRTECRTLR
ncbi:MAG: hypothetical protein KZQ76_12380 [Candidatus Thiodiazotropha sp. (ex Epidulcina cf. delphinae)]|nr:hypothetical protein [Candidatus Thiodiazotropha sp. (ex Epidulcina cf. delphinae)]